MNLDQRKIAVIAVVVLILMTGGVLLYVKNKQTTQNTPAATDQNSSFFPINQERTPVSGTGTQTPSETGVIITTSDPSATSTASVNIPLFRKITQKAVTGSVPVGTGTTSLIRYTDAESGNIYDTLYTGTTKRITNTTLIKIAKSLFSRDGKLLINTYLDNRAVLSQGYTLPVGTSTAGTTLTPNGFTKKEIVPVASPAGNALAYLSVSHTGARLFLGDFTKQEARQIWSSPVSEWLAEWVSTDTLTLTTKPSDSVPGYFYTLSVKTGAQKRILGDIPGLTALLSPKGDTVLYTSVNRGDLSTNTLTIKENRFVEFPVTTLPEKCLWSTKNANLIWCAVPRSFPTSYSYPDDWYKGLFSFSDDIWAIRLDTGEAQIIFNPSTAGARESIDATHLMTDTSETYLYFTNKQNGTLWGLHLDR